MSDFTEVETEDVEGVAVPHESESARYLRIRTAAKARADITVAENAKEAKAAKRRAQAKAPVVKGQAEFNKRAHEIEKQINASSDSKADSKEA